MGDYFLAEDGRERVAGTSYCRATNAFKRTGGYLGADVVPHSENYYSTDVPEIVGFFCEAASRLGGETGLFCASRAYGLLSPSLRAKLQTERFDAQAFRTCAEVAAACGLPADASVEELARGVVARGVAWCELASSGSERRSSKRGKVSWPGAAGTDATDSRGQPMASVPAMLELRMSKPTIITGAGARRRQGALVLNAAELGAHGLRALSRELDRRVYADASCWRIHRLLWRCARALPLFARLLSLVEVLSVAIRRPLGCLAYARRARLRAAAAVRRGGVRTDGSGRTLRAALRLHEAEEIGRALGRSVSLFCWREGDILLVDNLTVMHDGMPGRPWEPRTLHAMLFNPIHIPEQPQCGKASSRRRASPGLLDVGQTNGLAT
ncbi:hypothetical protein T492DRAFT_974609 [Pavlovales sp. CCMP2436]|nr:hypothetical protein T492DRAFT_974609 [Pavlovales sp. CCMP2436]